MLGDNLGAGNGTEKPSACDLFSAQAMACVHSLVGDRVFHSLEEVKKALVEYAIAHLQDSRHRAIMELVEGPKVLDIGCEIGVIPKAISSKVEHVLAIDTRPEAIEIGETVFAAPNVEYRVGELEGLGLEDSLFDCVLFLETVEHVGNPMGLLKEIHIVLRPGGVLLLSTPNLVSYLELLRQLVRLWPSFRTDRAIEKMMARVAREAVGSGTHEDHLYSWSWETLYRLVHRCGFRYVTHRRVGFWSPSLPVGGRRFWPVGRGELWFLRPLIGPFCATLLLKVKAVK